VALCAGRDHERRIWQVRPLGQESRRERCLSERHLADVPKEVRLISVEQTGPAQRPRKNMPTVRYTRIYEQVDITSKPPTPRPMTGHRNRPDVQKPAVLPRHGRAEPGVITNIEKHKFLARSGYSDHNRPHPSLLVPSKETTLRQYLLNVRLPRA